MYDVIIIGAGAAGLTASIFTGRRHLSTLIITKDIGGQTSTTDRIENYPGIPIISGPNLIENMRDQSIKYGGKIVCAEILSILEKSKGVHSVNTSIGLFDAKSIIFSFGLTPKSLEVPGEKKFFGISVFHDPQPLERRIKGTVTIVVGGGNSALAAALFVSMHAKQVHLIHRKTSFSAEAVLIEKVWKQKNIEIHYDTTVLGMRGEKTLEKLIISSDNKEKEILCDYVFEKIGFSTATKFLSNFVQLTEKGEIQIDTRCRTSREGVFACGDVTNIPYKQVVISAGEGAKAALETYKYLQEKSGKPAIMIDWK